MNKKEQKIKKKLKKQQAHALQTSYVIINTVLLTLNGFDNNGYLNEKGKEILIKEMTAMDTLEKIVAPIVKLHRSDEAHKKIMEEIFEEKPDDNIVSFMIPDKE